MKKDTETLVNTDEYVPKWKYDELLGKYKHLEFQLTELKRLIFGNKSERFIASDSTQLGLFTEEAAQENTTEPQQISYSRQRKRKSI